jgi:hypothetical protein
VKTPHFSIVIPTRNRGHLLPYALRSALAQDYGDYEIVVVANNCQDNTREVVKSFDDRRIVYYETDRTLPMPENWDYAWTKATGEYVIYLPDDDALVPSALSQIAEKALHGTPRVISWEDAIYCYPGWDAFRMQNALLLFNFGSTVVEDVPAKVYLQECARFEFAWSSPLPKMLNSACHRAFFEEWRQKLGKLLFPVAPDYAFAWIATQICDTIRVLHLPLTVRGISQNSAGSNAGLTPAGEAFYEEFGDFDFFAETLLSIPTTINHIAGTFLRVNAAFEKLGIEPKPLDKERFLIALAKQFREFEGSIQNASSHGPALRRAAEGLSKQTQKALAAILDAPAPRTDVHQETLRELHARTARMATSDASALAMKAKQHGGDETCARCLLGLDKAVLAAPNWKYLYVFGEEIGANDPYAISQVVDRYYELLRRCGREQKLAQGPLGRVKAAFLASRAGRQ